LRKLRADLRTGIRDAIEYHLRHQPTKTSKAGIKHLRGVSRPQFRLRVGDIRVFYDVVGTEVHILAVVSKEQAEKWLRGVGE
jgi:mRNA-degrading endonuclease RelE of RelBE toxin-antitoxin system